MPNFPKNLQNKLLQREETNSLSSLTALKDKIDFSSNDYLGFSKNTTISKNADSLLKGNSFINGSTGSRLVSGTHKLHFQVEQEISNFHNSETGLLFNSGYDANIGLFLCYLTKRRYCYL